MNQAAAPRPRASPYLEWAKTRSQARYNLATSGVLDYPLAELPVDLAELELSGDSLYGWPPLQQALARKCEAPPDCVVAAIGTSLANHLAMAALLEPGEAVLIEAPTYEPLLSLARYLGARVLRFPRRAENGFRIEPRDVERALEPGTRLVVLTNLHNPSGVLTDRDTLAAIGEVARGAGARVLVDEVYLECLERRASFSGFSLGPHFVTTSSLTKAYGLSGLRCGFVLAEPDLARRIWRLNDLFGVVPAHPAERLAVIALRHLDRIAARARALVEANRAVLRSTLPARPELDLVLAEHGTVVFPRLLGREVEGFCARLRERHDTSVVPGGFFERPDHFRVGIGGPTEMVREGLGRLAAALTETA